MYTFSDERFDPPMDPHGKRGPSLEDFLHFPNRDNRRVKKHKGFSRGSSSALSGLAKRYIFIDGSNVGYEFTNHKRMDVKGIEKCIKFFSEQGHRVQVYMAASWLEKNNVSKPNKKKIEKLIEEKKVVLTPSGKDPKGQKFDCYEDDYLIRNAFLNQGIVVSNDNFREMSAKDPTYREQIEKRVLPYNFIDGELWLPSDPLGKDKVTLEMFLHHPELPTTELTGGLSPYLTPPWQTCTVPSIPRPIFSGFAPPHPRVRHDQPLIRPTPDQPSRALDLPTHPIRHGLIQPSPNQPLFGLHLRPYSQIWPAPVIHQPTSQGPARPNPSSQAYSNSDALKDILVSNLPLCILL